MYIPNTACEDRINGLTVCAYLMLYDVSSLCNYLFFFFKQKTAYEIRLSLVGSEMCIRDRTTRVSNLQLGA